MRIVPLLHAALLTVLSLASAAEEPASPLRDIRTGPLKDLDGYFPFTPPARAEEWHARASRLRMQVQVSLGLWPEPSRTPLKAVIHGRLEQDGYAVEKVYFESMPGFFVTGSLYRPLGKSGPFPAVLCPHGHWPEGRFGLLGAAELKKEIASGQERLAEGGRSRFQALCVQLARMGCVAFQYDMLGYADSQQISFELAHKFAKQRPEMNMADAWGLYSARAESHLQSLMGLQTWNSIRAVDFIVSLPDVDAKRIGMTGGSGGGTQTFIAAALDPRIAVTAPAVMVSTGMQGGCTCENASLLRVGTGNVEIASLCAPKPVGMTAADDWTREMETKGFPEMQTLWSLLGKPENVALWPMLQFPHNYNSPSRKKIHGWFHAHFALPTAEIEEREYRVLERTEMTVWDASHPSPPGGSEFERELLQWWHKDTAQQLNASPDAFRRIARPGIEAIVGRTLLDAGRPSANSSKQISGKYEETRLRLRNEQWGEELPVLLLGSRQPMRRVAIWLDEHGTAGLFQGTNFRPEVEALLAAGWAVAGVDLLHQGEFLRGSPPITQTPKVANPREAPAFTYGYNRALLAQRVHDVLTVTAYLQGTEPGIQIALIALGKMGPIGVAARATSEGAIRAAILETAGFRFGAVEDWRSPDFLPGGAHYGDIPGFLALAAPAPTVVIGEQSVPGLPVRCYKEAGAAAAFQTLPSAQGLDFAATLSKQLGE